MIFTKIQRLVKLDFLFPQRNTQTTCSGQSLIEFIMTLSFSLGLVFVFFSIAFNATDGYLVHYATYMASRTYLVTEINSNKPEGSDSLSYAEAQKVLATYIKASKGTMFVNDPGAVVGYPYVGIGFRFKQKFTFGMVGTKEDMNLTSESFLGKEPTRATCAKRICKSFEGVGGVCEKGFHFTLYDNGC